MDQASYQYPGLCKESCLLGALGGGDAQTSDGGVTTHQHRDAKESFSREELPSRNLRNE